MNIKWAKRIEDLPPYLFAEIDKKKNQMIEKGVDVIDLGVGDPDIPTPNYIIDALKKAAGDPTNHTYPSYVGMRTFREAASNWYKKDLMLHLIPMKRLLL